MLVVVWSGENPWDGAVVWAKEEGTAGMTKLVATVTTDRDGRRNPR
jgi:hypothetical protein